MAPHAAEVDFVKTDESTFPKLKAPQAGPWDRTVNYRNLVLFSYYHAAALYGLYLALTWASWLTLVYTITLYIFSILGLTAGNHRLWSHRSYKAKLPLKIILLVFNTIAGQYTVIDWTRDHRLHHRYSDTDADPHNATRGFFYSHVGWRFVGKHPEVERRSPHIDVSDLESDPVLMFQKRHAAILFVLGSHMIPTLLPLVLWGETLNNAYHMNFLRFIACMNAVQLVNSAAHMFGYKPYDKDIASTENKLTNIATLGEGFHNYHHAFPWDYRTGEFGNRTYSLTTRFIDFFEWVGWAYDLKSVDDDVVTKRALRNGDGSRLIALNQ